MYIYHLASVLTRTPFPEIATLLANLVKMKLSPTVNFLPSNSNSPVATVMMA